MKVSNCRGAPARGDGAIEMRICPACKEHCDWENDEEESTEKPPTDTEIITFLESAFRNKTIHFSFMRFAGWEAEQPWLLDKHNYGFKRWQASTFRRLITAFMKDKEVLQ